MSDFKTMFPDMEKEVIEAVLRANQGAVDATIDQLLAMSVDNQVSVFLSPHNILNYRSTNYLNDCDSRYVRRLLVNRAVNSRIEKRI